MSIILQLLNLLSVHHELKDIAIQGRQVLCGSLEAEPAVVIREGITHLLNIVGIGQKVDESVVDDQGLLEAIIQKDAFSFEQSRSGLDDLSVVVAEGWVQDFQHFKGIDMCLIPQTFLQSITNLEHAFSQDLSKAILEDECMELLLILRNYVVVRSQGIDLTDEGRTVLEYSIDDLKYVNTGVLLHQFLRDGVAHLIEKEQTVPNLQGSSASTRLEPVLLVEVMEVYDEQTLSFTAITLELVIGEWRKDDVLEEDVGRHEHHGNEDGFRYIIWIGEVLQLHLSVDGETLLEVKTLRDAFHQMA